MRWIQVKGRRYWLDESDQTKLVVKVVAQEPKELIKFTVTPPAA